MVTTKKWEFLKDDEIVYSSGLDIFGDLEHRAWAKCIPKIGEIMGGMGWEKRLKDLTRDDIRHLILTITLEFEKWMKAELGEDENNVQPFFDFKLKIPLAPTPDEEMEKEKADPTPPPAGLIPPGMEAPTKPRTGPVTDDDFPF
jgi:hypothetical protein